MPNHDFCTEEWFYCLESQTNPKLPNRLELLPGLRARFGNLLREDIVSVALVSDGKTNLVVIAALGQPLITLPIDHHLPADLLNWLETSDLRNLLPVAGEWVNALDGFETAREFGLFTPHALALIERVSSNLQESAYESAQKAMQFYASLARNVGKEFSPAIRKKIESSVRTEYKANPANDMAGEYPENEWQELGSMLYEGSHVLLQMGIDQLRDVVYRKISALSQGEKLAWWFGHCEELGEWLEGRALNDNFNVLQDTDTFDALLDSICDDLQSAMQSDWEKRLREIENDETESDE